MNDKKGTVPCIYVTTRHGMCDLIVNWELIIMNYEPRADVGAKGNSPKALVGANLVFARIPRVGAQRAVPLDSVGKCLSAAKNPGKFFVTQRQMIRQEYKNQIIKSIN